MKVNEVLRTQREQKRISLSAVRKETRISLEYLEALEAGKWDAFPAEVYLLGFLRKYSIYLGLNPEEMLGLYKKELEEVKLKQVEKTKQEIETHEKEKSISQFKGLALAFVVMILALWWLFTIRHAPKKQAVQLPPMEISKKLNSESSLVEVNALSLTVKTLSTVWVRVVADKKLSFEGFLPSHANRVWQAKDEFLVRIGNVNSLHLYLNNREIDSRPGAQQDVNEIVLTRQTLEDESRFLKSAETLNNTTEAVKEKKPEPVEKSTEPKNHL